MIRINLLPVPKARKSEALVLQLVAGVVILAGIAGVSFFISSQKEAEIAEIQGNIAQRQREIEELKAKVGEVEKYKRQAQELERQLGVIRNLEKGRSGPVKMMDELTQIIPRKLWISSFKEAGKRVTIDGQAESGPVISDFLDALKKSKHFTNPELSIVTGSDTQGQKTHKFTITAGVRYDI